MYRTIIIPTKDSLTIPIPIEFIGKQVEVIAFRLEEIEIGTKNTYSWENAKDFYKKNSIDMSNFKFDREEANER